MRYMIASTDIASYCRVRERIGNVAMLLYPKAWRIPFCSYACDNGVYAAYGKGRVWDQQMHEEYLKMLSKIPSDNPPMWVLLPDAVADWRKTVELASLYIPLLRQHNLPVALALQDGCDFAEALSLEPDWVFVGGSTEWKEQNIHTACEYFHARGVKVHIGRVNTARRLRLCQSAGADSADGTVLNKYRDAKIGTIKRALDQQCLII